jgi:hypothetical protein
MTESTPPTRARPRRRWASALGGVFFGLLLAAAGGVFCWLLGRAGLRAIAMESWPATPCTIIESRLATEPIVPNSPLSHRPVVRYRYRHKGALHESDRISRTPPKSAHAAKMQAVVDRFPPGSASVCYLDPTDPATSVLLRDRRTPLYSLWFPALFVIGGLGVAIGSIRRAVRQPAPAP